MNLISDLLEAFPASKQALIAVDRDGERRVWHFGELIAMSAGLSGAFAARGVGRGDVVMTLVGNRVEWVLAVLACWRMGAVALPCNTQLRRHDLELRASIAAPALCVGDEQLLGELPDGIPYMTLAEVAETLDEDRPQHPPVEIAMLAPEDPALIVFTSGTTGEPRAALHPQRYLPGQRAQAERWLGARAGELVWCTTATGWSKSARNVFLAPWLCGASAMLVEGRFEPHERLELIEREAVDVLCQAPTEYRVLAKGGELGPSLSLRRMVSAGEALNPEVIDAWREATGLEIADGYGQTETGHLAGNLDGAQIRPGSMGKPLPGFELRVVDSILEVRVEQLPDLLQPVPRLRSVRRRVVVDRRRRPRGCRRLPLVRGPRRRPDPLGRLSDRPVRGRVGPAHAPVGGRGGRGCRPGSRARLSGAGDRRPARGRTAPLSSHASSRSTSRASPPRTSTRESSSSPPSCRRRRAERSSAPSCGPTEPRAGVGGHPRVA